MRRLLFGGSFDPPHQGHVDLARAAGRAIGAERVSLIPAGQAPHKLGGAVASGDERLAMCRAAVAGDPFFDVLDVELRREGPSYTLDTLRELIAGPCAGDSLMLLLGQDSLVDLPKWRGAAEIARLAPVVVVPRPGAPEPDWDGLAAALGAEVAQGIRGRVLRVRPTDVSSTTVRRRIADGNSIRCWVPDPVADLIETRGLYGARPRGVRP